MSTGLRYRVLRKIADGGMAEIFLAMQLGAEGFQKPVVLKRILPAFARDPTFVRMFLDEAHIASTLSHSNIVQVLDLGKAGDQYFLVLELVDGWSLEQVRLRAQKAKLKLPLPLALYIAGGLCRALAYAHTRARDGKPLGIVHRDVNPHNVLVSREGDVKLADFGIAKAIGRREKSLSGVIKGKISYMSPEQSLGEELDARSDLFSVGTVLYTATLGKKPFDGPNDLEVLLAIRKAKYERPAEAVKGFNPDVDRLVARALRVDREKRWQTAEQMGDRIDAILAKLGTPTGASALKRWLAELSDRDGAKPPADIGPSAVTSGTIELGSGDLELQDVSPPAGSPARADVRAAEAAAAVRARAAARAAPSGRGGRMLRWVALLLTAALLAGAGAWLARPWMPPWMARPVDAWIERLGLGGGAGPAPGPGSATLGGAPAPRR